MKTAFNTMAWGLHAPSLPAHDPAHAVVAAAEGAEFTLYGRSRRGLELIGSECGPNSGNALETLARRLEDCDLVLATEAVPELWARLERAGVAVHRLAASAVAPVPQRG